jgi:hypothetical protein
MGEDAFNTFLSSATLAATPFTIFAHRVASHIRLNYNY